MLSSLIQPANPLNPSAEDVFSSALSMISPEDVSVLHGDPGSSVTYSSTKFGKLELRLAEPQTERERKLFAQYLWNAGVLMAELIDSRGDGRENTSRDTKKWSVKGERVLELGAGTGLAGIVCVLAGAEQVVISDYPVTEVLATIETNIQRNIPSQLIARVAAQGHEWGVLMDDFSRAYAHRFKIILSSDCLWMPGQHQALAASMLHFLSLEVDARVWLIAGFHTGRANVAAFFETGEKAGLGVDVAWERDVDGNEREWTGEQKAGNDDIVERKKWLLVAILRRTHHLPATKPYSEEP